MKPSLRFALAALLVCIAQTAALAYMVLGRAAILRNGETVMLRTAPVDPRDLLRGDYVILSYDVSTVPASAISGTWPAEKGRQSLWVRLVKGVDGISTVGEAAFQPLAPVAGSVVVKSQPFDYWPSDPKADQRVTYGIERYYVPEGEGRALEAARDAETLTVAVSIGGDGTAQLRALYRNGTMVYEEPIF